MLKENIKKSIASAVKVVMDKEIAEVVSQISYYRDGDFYCQHKTKGEIKSEEMARLLANDIYAKTI